MSTHVESVPKHFDLLIRGGTVIDGTRRPRFVADIGIVGDRIAAIGELAESTADAVVSAKGKIVAPGFIDSHTHDDQVLLSQPHMPFKISQGVTTVVTGNCGISIAPLRDSCPMPAPLNLLDDQDSPRFATFADYMAQLRQQPPSVNVAALVGHSTLRAMCMSSLDRAARPDEIRDMRGRLEEALEAGALGMSTGTFYPPAMHAPTEEIVEVGRPLSAVDALYVTHMRDEADRSLEALEESFFIGRELNVPVVISHHKLKFAQNFGKSGVTLARIAEAMKRQRVYLDCYPYNASSTMLHTDAARLHGKVLIASSDAYPECSGRDLDEVAAEWQVSKTEAARRLQPASAVYYNMDERDVQSILAFEDTMIGSDGIPTGDQPHPRLWGTFPRVLGRYSRELGLFSLETAVWKMTGLTASRFGLAHRGQLAAGCFADLVVFDAETIRDAATYDVPKQMAEGIETVVVNGVVTWRTGSHQGARNGRVISRSNTAHRYGLGDADTRPHGA